MRPFLIIVPLLLAACAEPSTTSQWNPTAPTPPSYCGLVGDLPCQVPGPVVEVPPVVVPPEETPPQGPPPSEPSPSPTPSDPNCGESTVFVPTSPRGQQYIWLVTCRGLRADSYAAWIQFRCQNPAAAAQQDAAYVARVANSCN